MHAPRYRRIVPATERSNHHARTLLQAPPRVARPNDDGMLTAPVEAMTTRFYFGLKR